MSFTDGVLEIYQSIYKSGYLSRFKATYIKQRLYNHDINIPSLYNTNTSADQVILVDTTICSKECKLCCI